MVVNAVFLIHKVNIVYVFRLSLMFYNQKINFNLFSSSLLHDMLFSHPLLQTLILSRVRQRDKY